MVKKIFLFLLLLITFGYAEDQYLNIDADFFEADEQKQRMYFKGHVKMTKQQDILTSKTLLINMQASAKDKNKQVPKDYVASGNVQFTIHTKDNILKGKGDNVYYYPDEKKYVIVGDGYLEDIKEGKKVTADKIYVDEKTGYSKVDSKAGQPVKFRLKLDNKDQKEKK
jgi:lipopolysaccharide export system protein LptA